MVAAALALLSGCPASSNTLPKSDYPAMPGEIMQTEIFNLDGTKFKLEDYRGKVLLVNLWATWCGPCRREMPDLVKLQQDNKNRGFEIIGVNVDESEDAELIKQFSQSMGLNYQLGMSDHNLYSEFVKLSKFDAIPQSFLIDREGRLTGVFVGGGKAVPKLIEAANKLAQE